MAPVACLTCISIIYARAGKIQSTVATLRTSVNASRERDCDGRGLAGNPVPPGRHFPITFTFHHHETKKIVKCIMNRFQKTGRAFALATILAMVIMTSAGITQQLHVEKNQPGNDMGGIVASLPDKTLPFAILGDDNWTNYADSGDGSVLTPWVLDGFDIDLGGAGIGMNFTNCTEYVIIRNSTIIDALVYSIYMVDSANVDFENIALDGCAATMFYGDNVTNVTINDAVLYNANTGIDIDVGQDIIISNTSIDLMTTNGIELSDTWGLGVVHVNITNVDADDVIYCDNVDGAIFSDINIMNCTDHAFFIDDSSWLVISDTTFTNTTGLYVMDSTEITMMTCSAVNTTGNATEFWNTTEIGMDDIDIENTNASGISIDGCSNATLDSIFIYDDEVTDVFDSQIGLDFADSDNINVTFSIIENMSDDGIAMWNMTYVLIDDIWIRNFGDEGVVMSGCFAVSIDGFFIYDDNDADTYDSFDGFYISDCLLIIIKNGGIENATFSGIYIDDSTDSCTAMAFDFINIRNCNTSILVEGDHYTLVFREINTYLSASNAIVVINGDESQGVFFIEIETFTTTGDALAFANVANITCENVTLDTNAVIALAIGLEFENVIFTDNISISLAGNVSMTNCTFDDMDEMQLFTLENVTIVNSTFDLSAATLNITTIVNMTIQHSIFHGMDTVAGNASAAGLNFTNNAYSDYFVTDFGNQVDPNAGWSEGDILPMPYDRLNDTTPFYSVGLFGNLVPVAHFTLNVNPSNLIAGHSYTYTYDGTYGNDVNVITWSFGDSGASVSHAYSQAGVYMVIVTITDGSGDVSTYTRMVTVHAASSGGGSNPPGGGINPFGTIDPQAYGSSGIAILFAAVGVVAIVLLVKPKGKKIRVHRR
jgi:hypothetical protein